MSVYSKMQNNLFEIDQNASKMNIEIWKTIKDFPNYQISNMGRIWSKKRNRLLKPFVRKNTQYSEITLCNSTEQRNFLIHRLVAISFIANTYNKRCVDHINNKTTDNKLLNLRWCTHQENSHNLSLASNNISGYRGVNFDKRRNKWRSSLNISNKNYHLGYFSSKEDAIAMRKKKANELYGEFTNACEKI